MVAEEDRSPGVCWTVSNGEDWRPGSGWSLPSKYHGGRSGRTGRPSSTHYPPGLHSVCQALWKTPCSTYREAAKEGYRKTRGLDRMLHVRTAVLYLNFALCSEWITWEGRVRWQETQCKYALALWAAGQLHALSAHDWGYSPKPTCCRLKFL